MIIGICGWISSGKDTIADCLVTNYHFHRDSFAATLKDAVAAVFGWDRELLEGKTKQAREWREQIDSWWANRLGIPHLTPRWVLQQWGTEVCRHGFHDEIWIASLENKLRQTKKDIVISDCRFPNEIKAIKNQGGKIVWVHRGPHPDFMNDAILVNKRLPGQDDAMERLKSVHPSEWAWVGANFDEIIDNNGTIDDLYQKISQILIVKSPE